MRMVEERQSGLHCAPFRDCAIWRLVHTLMLVNHQTEIHLYTSLDTYTLFAMPPR